MNLDSILGRINAGFHVESIEESRVIAVLLVVACLAAYEFLIYRVISHRAFYNRSFNITIAVLPFFISTIIMCLQTNIVITLGTIGALAIIRFRTAVKDPVDMVYLLWSIHTGIVCGCQLYSVAILTSLAVTIVLLLLENFTFGRKPYVIIFHVEDEKVEKLLADLKQVTKSYRVKSRNYTKSGVDMVIEASMKDVNAVAQVFKTQDVEKFSIITYDNEDVI